MKKTVVTLIPALMILARLGFALALESDEFNGASVVQTLGTGKASVQSILAQDILSEKISFLQLINEYRQQNELQILELNSYLQNAAQWMSEDMAGHDYTNHTDSLGRDFGQRLIDFGYTVSTYKGENIAAGQSTAAIVFQAWKNSADHNANMLSPNYKVIGIGLAYSSSAHYSWYWTTDFGGVQTDLTMPTATPGITMTPALTHVVSVTATPTLGIQRQAACDENISFYPSPARDQITFHWAPSQVQSVEIRIYNMAAELVTMLKSASTGAGILFWDTRRIAPGIYIYRSTQITDDRRTVQTAGKLVVIK